MLFHLVAAAVGATPAVLSVEPNVLALEPAEVISVYANRHQQQLNTALASIEVLERADILARQVNDLPALLNQLAGVNVSRDGGRGQNSGLFVRGGETGHTLVLVDGVRTGSATLGLKSLSMIPLHSIERIEIIRGPRAAWYGSDAIAGVIAITTRRPQQLELLATVGSYGLAELDAAFSTNSGPLRWSVHAGASRADGFDVRPDLDPDRDGYRQRYLKLAAEYQSDVGLWRWQTDVNSGVYQFDTAFGQQDQSDTLLRQHQLSWQQQHDTFSQQLTLSRNLDVDSPFGGGSRSPFETARDEATYQLTADWLPGLTLLGGLNWYQEQVAKVDPQYQQDSRINRALFAGASVQLQQWLIELAGRHDNITDYHAQNTWQLALGYQFNAHWLVRASRGSAFKVPSFNELYWPQFGNPALKPQQAISDELALRYQQAATELQLALFKRDITNLIQVGEVAQNVPLAAIEGAELSAHWQQQALSQQFAYTYLQAKNRRTGEDLVRRPKHSVNWRSAYQLSDWSVFVTADYQSSTFQGFDWNTGVNHPRLGGFTLWGLGAQYQFRPTLNVSLKLDNLTDKQYQTSIGYATAGANLALRLHYIPAG